MCAIRLGDDNPVINAPSIVMRRYMLYDSTCLHTAQFKTQSGYSDSKSTPRIVDLFQEFLQLQTRFFQYTVVDCAVDKILERVQDRDDDALHQPQDYPWRSIPAMSISSNPTTSSSVDLMELMASLMAVSRSLLGS